VLQWAVAKSVLVTSAIDNTAPLQRVTLKSVALTELEVDVSK